MDDSAIVSQRLQNQGLRTPLAGEPHEVVDRLAAMQAQEFAYAKWSVAQRTEGAGEAAIDRALAEGRILRTHVLRPTWHFVAARDIRWLMALSGPRVHALNKHYYGKYELSAVVLAKAAKVIVKALARGPHLTRDELNTRLRAAGIEAAGPRLAYIVMYAELHGLICSGPMRGKQHTYALLDERAPGAAAFSRNEALGELTRRYFTSRGPATLRDFAGWSGLTTADGKRGLEIAGKSLERIATGDREYWLSPAPPPIPVEKSAVDLLQAYDEYGMSYSESRDVMHEPGLVAPAGPSLMHLVIADGRLIGRWRHVPRKGGVDVETTFYRPLGQAEARASRAAIERYRAFKRAPRER